MCKSLEENVNPMPSGSGKVGAVIINSLSGLLAIGDIVMSSISSGLRIKDEKKHKKSIAIFDGINLILALSDFGLSCGVGYGIYAPMDASNKRISDSDYQKLIKSTSDTAGTYTTLWIIKTVIALFIPTISTLKDLIGGNGKIEPVSEMGEGNTPGAGKEDFDCMEVIDRINAGVHGVLCLVSAIFEVIACVEAGQVDGAKLTDKQKKDKSCFHCETVGFICDDVCSILDDIMLIGNIKNIPMTVIREVIKGACASALFAEAGIIGSA